MKNFLFIFIIQILLSITLYAGEPTLIFEDFKNLTNLQAIAKLLTMTFRASCPKSLQIDPPISSNILRILDSVKEISAIYNVKDEALLKENSLLMKCLEHYYFSTLSNILLVYEETKLSPSAWIIDVDPAAIVHTMIGILNSHIIQIERDVSLSGTAINKLLLENKHIVEL